MPSKHVKKNRRTLGEQIQTRVQDLKTKCGREDDCFERLLKACILSQHSHLTKKKKKK